MKRFIKSYFLYSRQQMRGIWVLLSLIILAFIFPTIFIYFKKEKVWDNSEYGDTIDRILKESNDKAVVKINPRSELFSFNPNTASKEELIRLGFSDKLSSTILNYRKAGGKFHSKEDLKKVYGISDEMYNKLSPFIIITQSEKKLAHEKKADTLIVENSKEWKNSYSKTEVPASGLLVELNSADSTELIKIPGIGPSFAKRIISFRSFVGGFYNKNQLLEVFGITPGLIKNIDPFITIDTSLIAKIDLNQADFKTLNKHPYIEYNQTKNLMKYKELMGKFNTVDDIVNNHLMDSASFSKVKPYLYVQ